MKKRKPEPRTLEERAQEREAKHHAIATVRYKLPYMSQNALAAVVQHFKDHGIPDVKDTRDVRASRDAATAAITTSYGPLVEDVAFERVDGAGNIMVEMMNPWAGLYHIVRTSKAFSDLLCMALTHNGGCSIDNPLELVLYSDEVTPGNQLALKHGRKVQSIYWSFEDFGFYLCREEMWVTGTVVSVSSVALIAGNWSHVMGAFTKKFISEDPGWDMSVAGIELQLHSGELIHVWVKFGDSVSDELAGANQLYGLKGPSGLKCCRWCSNVFNAKTTRTITDPLAVFHDCHKVKSFKRHTAATIDAVIDRLKMHMIPWVLMSLRSCRPP